MAEPKSVTIGIRAYKLDALIGARDRERLGPQPLEFDLSADIEINQEEDVLAQTVSYSDFAPLIREEAAKEPQLLETLAEGILERLLNLDPRIRAAEIEIRKPKAVKGASCSFVHQRKSR